MSDYSRKHLGCWAFLGLGTGLIIGSLGTFLLGGFAGLIFVALGAAFLLWWFEIRRTLTIRGEKEAAP